jgi:predicted nucleic acid-binding protein
LVQDYLSWEIVVNSPESAIQALEIEARYEISYWDALVLQAPESAGTAILYSERLGAGQKYGAIRVVSPLRSGAAR